MAAILSCFRFELSPAECGGIYFPEKEVSLDKLIIIIIIIIMINKFGTNGRIIQLMGSITAKSRKIAETVLRPTGLTLPQFGTLFALLQHDGNSQKELAGVMETDTTTIMVICDSLEKKGYLRRTPSPSDRRVNQIEITENGRESLAKALPGIYEVFEPLTTNLTEDESAALLPILERLFQLVCKMEQEKKP